MGLDWIKFKMLRASWLMLVVYLVLFALDIYSTFSVGELVPHLESNPLYIVSSSFLYLILANAIFLFVLLRWYDKGGMNLKFFMVGFFVAVCVIRLVAISGNFATGDMVADGTLTIEMAQQVTDTQKLVGYAQTVLLFMYLPAITSFITFLIFNMDHEARLRLR